MSDGCHNMLSCERLVIGIDLDNTLVSYDNLFSKLLSEYGFGAENSAKDKHSVRELLRALPDGEQYWRALQAQAYGVRIFEADMSPGAKDFLLRARRFGCPVYIVSHKTRYAAIGDVDLHAAAVSFLEHQGVFDPDGPGLCREHVFFEQTRGAKISRIASLKCTHFVDDLPEVFAENDFPETTLPVLFAPNPAPFGTDVVTVSSFNEFSDLVFGSSSV